MYECFDIWFVIENIEKKGVESASSYPVSRVFQNLNERANKVVI